MPIIYAYLIAFLVSTVDQVSKYYVVFELNLVEVLRIDSVAPFVNFRMAWNQGINFGLFGNGSFTSRIILISISIIICLFLTWWFRKTRSKFVLFFVGLIIGGAVGNLIDRVLYGAVADFLNVTCCGLQNPFSFNVADIAIFLGAVGLILHNENANEKAVSE